MQAPDTFFMRFRQYTHLCKGTELGLRHISGKQPSLELCTDTAAPRDAAQSPWLQSPWLQSPGPQGTASSDVLCQGLGPTRPGLAVCTHLGPLQAKKPQHVLSFPTSPFPWPCQHLPVTQPCRATLGRDRLDSSLDWAHWRAEGTGARQTPTSGARELLHLHPHPPQIQQRIYVTLIPTAAGASQMHRWKITLPFF